MTLEQVRLSTIILVLVVLSGYSDAQGALYAANIWQAGKFVATELGKSALGFGFGIGFYWLSLRYMNAIGIVAPEIQVIIWTAVMLIGVAIGSGRFFRWPLTEQIIAFGVVAAITWLSIRTGGD